MKEKFAADKCKLEYDFILKSASSLFVCEPILHVRLILGCLEQALICLVVFMCSPNVDELVDGILEPVVKIVLPQNTGHAGMSEDVGIATLFLFLGEGPVLLCAPCNINIQALKIGVSVWVSPLA